MRRLRSLQLLLLLLVLAASLYFPRLNGALQDEALLAQGNAATVPEVVPPTGKLLAAFKQARPATLQIEIDSNALAVGTVPLGVASGFFISPDGLVLTAYHVLDPGSTFPGEVSLEARSPGGEQYHLRLVGFDAYLDLALLQAVGAKDVPYLPLASSPLEVGSNVVAIGNSRGEFLQGRAGKIERLDVAAIQANFASGTFELSAALAPGDSGGPVISEAGEVVGVVSYIAFSPPETNSLSGPLSLLRRAPNNSFGAYAVPVLAGSDTLTALRAGRRRDVPVIGFSVGVMGIRQNYEPRGTAKPGLGPLPGVVVGKVAPGGSAAAAGLRDAVQQPIYDANGSFQGVRTSADVVVSVDGERTPTYDDLVRVLRHKQVGQVVEVGVQRGGKLLELKLKLGGKRAVFNQ